MWWHIWTVPVISTPVVGKPAPRGQQASRPRVFFFPPLARRHKPHPHLGVSFQKNKDIKPSQPFWGSVIFHLQRVDILGWRERPQSPDWGGNLQTIQNLTVTAKPPVQDIRINTFKTLKVNSNSLIWFYCFYTLNCRTLQSHEHGRLNTPRIRSWFKNIDVTYSDLVCTVLGCFWEGTPSDPAWGAVFF